MGSAALPIAWQLSFAVSWVLQLREASLALGLGATSKCADIQLSYIVWVVWDLVSVHGSLWLHNH